MKKQKLKSRQKKGFSLIFVMSIGVIAVTAALAITASLIPAHNYVASERYMNECASIAENSIQYSIAELNAAAENGSLPSFNSSIAVPNAIRGNANVSVNITKIDPTQLPNNLVTSPIYQSQNTYMINGIQTTIVPDYRILVAIVQYATFTRTLKVIVGPSQFVNANPQNPQVPATPYFTQSLVANGNLNLQSGNVSLEPSYLSALPPNVNPYSANLISSNQKISISGPSTIDGNINAFNSQNGTSLVAPPLPTDGSTPSVIVKGNILFSSSTTNPPTANSSFLQDAANSPTPGANVLADGVNGGQFGGSISPNSALQSVTAPGQVQAPTQAAQVLSDPKNPNVINVSPPTAGNIIDLGSINMTGSQAQTLTLSPGQYTANSINLGPNATLQIQNGGSNGQAVQIYLQGSSGGSPLNIAGNIAGSTSASNFQVFYNGSQPIQLAAGPKTANLYGLFYAPNANLTIDTTGGAFHGAIVANNLNVSGSGGVFFDPNSVSTTSGGAKAGIAPGPGYTASSVPQYFTALSWQEKTN